MASRAKRRLESGNQPQRNKRIKVDAEDMNTAEKISLANLSVQHMRMSVEVKQTKLLSYATQEQALKSQIESARQLALIVCPTFDDSNKYWKDLMGLMAEQRALSKRMAELTNDDNLGLEDNSALKNVQHMLVGSVATAKSVPEEINVDSSSSSNASSSVTTSPKKRKTTGL